MSELPKCRLCGCTPIRLIDGSIKHDEYASRCSLRLSVLKGEEWNLLMGGGEPVGFRHRANGHSEWVTVFGRSPDSYELRELEIEALYTRPQAAQVDGAVLRDAARYRWLRRKVGACGPAGDDYSEWRFTFPTNFTLKVSELNVTDIESDFNNAIDTAMKGEG